MTAAAGDLTRADKADARLALLAALKGAGYGFITPTPATHRRYLRQRGEAARAADLRDVFGWNLPFDRALLGEPLADLARAAGAIGGVGREMRATLRVGSLGPDLFLHSAFPPRR